MRNLFSIFRENLSERKEAARQRKESDIALAEVLEDREARHQIMLDIRNNIAAYDHHFPQKTRHRGPPREWGY